jgi:hypothetical protein
MRQEPEFPFVFTPPMKRRLSRRVLNMLRNALRHFPELQGKKIIVGYTSAHLGSAVVPLRAGSRAKLTIRLRVRKLAYNTIGHEMTHLLQGLSRIHWKEGSPEDAGRVPSGEKQCDIWTLARSSLFCDDAPTYLRLPRTVRENWPVYARSVRRLCIAALEKRKTHRFYMRWLELRIKDLARRPMSIAKAGDQLTLPF